MQREITTIEIDSWGDTWINGERVDGHGKPFADCRRNRCRLTATERRERGLCRRRRRTAMARVRKAWCKCWKQMGKISPSARRAILHVASFKHAEKPMLGSWSQYKRCLLTVMCSRLGVPMRPVRGIGSMDESLCLHCDGEGFGKKREDDCRHLDVPF